MPEPDLSEFEEITNGDELRRMVADLQRRLRRAKAKSDDLVEATLEGSRAAMLALGPMPPVPAPAKSRQGKGPEVALWHLTDWQGAKVTTTYNSEVMRERILRYCDKARHLTDLQRSHHPVDECVILLGGDMGEGLFNYPAQPYEIDATIFDQFARIARVEVEVVRFALSVYDRVTVISEWGNHGRIGSKRAVVRPSDNFDRMIHELARSLLEGEERLTWEDCPEDIQHVEIGNYRALLIHGDEIGRNGFASKNTIVQAANRWKSGAHKWHFRDVYVGHYHTHGEDPLADGQGAVYWTGSPESDNRYASDRLAASSSPSQRLHFIDPDAGRVTAQFKVWVAE
jgi:hypothetical protein